MVSLVSISLTFIFLPGSETLFLSFSADKEIPLSLFSPPSLLTNELSSQSIAGHHRVLVQSCDLTWSPHTSMFCNEPSLSRISVTSLCFRRT
jgi:hypothetical protein